MPSHHLGTDPDVLVHQALLYRGSEELARAVADFVLEGVAAGEPAMVAAPGAHLDAIRDALGPDAERVRLVDMSELGRNPGRIIPAVRDWAQAQRPGRRLRFVGEPIWAGRRPSEIAEATRHEALLNLAFAGIGVTILCPYDAEALPPQVLADAERTHPELVCEGEHRPSPAYADPLEVYDAGAWTLPAPTGPVTEVPLDDDLARVRGVVRERAKTAALAGERLERLLLAATEAVANSLRHGGAPGVLRLWQDADELVCEIADHGRISDPLVGRRTPAPSRPDGRGLWLINQLCDLVQLRPRADGTTLRLHMRVA